MSNSNSSSMLLPNNIIDIYSSKFAYMVISTYLVLVCYMQVAIPIPKRLFGSQQKKLCNMRPEKGRKCYLLVVLLWSIHPKLMYGSKHAGQVQFSADWSGIWVSLKLKKTHHFVFCWGQRFVPSIGSIVKVM